MGSITSHCSIKDPGRTCKPDREQQKTKESVSFIIILFLRVQPKGYFDSYEWWRFVINTQSETRILDLYSRRRASLIFSYRSPPGFRTSRCPRPFYSRLHRVKLIILWISDASSNILPQKWGDNYWKSQNWWAVWIFQWFKPWFEVLDNQQTWELRIWATCFAIIVYMVLEINTHQGWDFYSH